MTRSCLRSQDRWPVGWDKTCTACHPIADLHPARGRGPHRDRRGVPGRELLRQRVQPEPGHTDMLSCHTISNIADVHSTMPGNGCAVCHGDGKTPAQECLDCHKPGYANTYTVPGTPSADIFASTSPSNDEYITPGLDVHDHSGRPAHLLRGQHSVDVGDPGEVRDDHVHRRRRSPLRVQRTVDTVERQDHPRRDLREGEEDDRLARPEHAGCVQDRWADVPELELERAHHGVDGDDRGLPVLDIADAGIDYTREPLYGELVNQNPATGQDWTPDELNGVDPDSSLQAFGVNLTAVGGGEQRQPGPDLPEGHLPHGRRERHQRHGRHAHLPRRQREVPARSVRRAGRSALRGHQLRRTAGTRRSTTRTATTSVTAATAERRRSARTRVRGCGTASAATRTTPSPRRGRSH